MPVFYLSKELIFPPAHLATRDGLLAIGGDLSPERVLLAYKKGIFPWYSQGDPILWWSPDPRMILFPERFKISKSLMKKIRANRFTVSFDRCFEMVIELCARIRTEKGQGTWITNDMHSAYIDLYNLGFAHSVEIWRHHQLVGGLYGLSLGRCFFGESMFSRESDASKVALYHLVSNSKSKRINLIDCQVPSDHLKSLGAVTISREEFLAKLNNCLQFPTQIGIWETE